MVTPRRSRPGRTPSQSPVKYDWPGACALSDRCAWARALVPKWWVAQSRQSVAQASFADRHRSILRITWSRESHEPSTFSNQGNRHRLLKVLLGPTHSSLRAEFYPRALFCRPLKVGHSLHNPVRSSTLLVNYRPLKVTASEKS